MENKGIQQVGDRWVMTIDILFPFDLPFWFKIHISSSRVDITIYRRFFKESEHAPNRYIPFMLGQYIDTPKDLVWLGDTDNQKIRKI
jgi:hypothetical protein